MARLLGRRGFLGLACAVMAAGFGGWPLSPRSNEDDIVLVGGWVLKRSDLRHLPPGRRAIPLQTLS